MKTLTRAMRLAVAKDVIQQLNAGVYSAEQGRYIDFGFDYERCPTSNLECPTSTDVQSAVRSVKICGVCAMGAMFLSAVRLFNGVSAEELDDFAEGGEMHSHIRREMFGGDRWHQTVEAIFEDYNGRFSHISPEDRLRAIVVDIIDHKGEVNTGSMHVRLAKAEQVKKKAFQDAYNGMPPSPRETWDTRDLRATG